WSSLRTIDIDFDNTQPTSSEPYEWRDAMFYSLGGEFAMNDRLTLRAGVAFDEAPVTDARRTPRLPDADRTWFSLGATYALSDALEVSAAYTYITIDDPTINTHSSSGSLLVGEFEGDANLFGVSAQYKF